MKKVQREIFYVFSPFLRVFHWIMVASIIILFVTGLLITKPAGILATEPTATSMSVDLIRSIHFTVAYIFLAAFILKVYGFIINKGDRLFPHFWRGYFYAQTVDVALHYMFLRNEHASYLRNPLARSSYVLLYVLVAIEFFTGFAMYLMTEPDAFSTQLFAWVNVVLGGEMITHYVHHYVAWFIILFAIGHIYMVIRAEFMEGESEVSSMFAGTKILAHHPLDEDDVDPDELDNADRLKRWTNVGEGISKIRNVGGN